MENQENPLYFEQHVFCCTNQREAGATRGCCKAKGGDELRDYLKKRAKELKLPKTRINAAGCLDRCELGPVMVVYPQGIWYHCESREDAEEILQKHLVGGVPVERLMLYAKQKRLS